MQFYALLLLIIFFFNFQCFRNFQCQFTHNYWENIHLWDTTCLWKYRVRYLFHPVIIVKFEHVTTFVNGQFILQYIFCSHVWRYSSLYWWIGARLQYLQCWSTGDTAVSHHATHMYICLPSSVTCCGVEVKLQLPVITGSCQSQSPADPLHQSKWLTSIRWRSPRGHSKVTEGMATCSH